MGHESRTARPLGRALVATLAWMLAVGCTDAPVGGVDSTPVPGDLALQLHSPHPDDGALRLRVEGPGNLAVTPANPDDVVFSRETDGGLAIVVVGDRLEGTVARLAVPDIHDHAAYRVTVLDVADAGNRLRPPGDGYTVTVAPPGG